MLVMKKFPSIRVSQSWLHGLHVTVQAPIASVQRGSFVQCTLYIVNITKGQQTRRIVWVTFYGKFFLIESSLHCTLSHVCWPVSSTQFTMSIVQHAVSSIHCSSSSVHCSLSSLHCTLSTSSQHCTV